MDVFIDVVNQKLRVATNLRKYVSGTNQFVRFIFNLSDDWAGLTTRAEFLQNENVFSHELDSNNSVYLPREIVQGKCSLSLKGTNDTVTATTEDVVFLIEKYAGSEGNTYFVDTADANVKETDMAEGTMAYAKGRPVFGKLPETENISIQSVGISKDGSNLSVRGTHSDDVILRGVDENIEINVPLSNFGVARPEDVMNGRSFTSENGIEIVGNHVCPNVDNMPVKTVVEVDVPVDDNHFAISMSDDGKTLNISKSYCLTESIIFEHSEDHQIPSGIFFYIPAERMNDDFGNATAEDVAVGKTFTSASGLKIPGKKVVPTIHSGSYIPDNSIGSDGDIYMVV